MFPILDILGRVIGYSARVLPGADDAQGKYINTPETQIYRKSHALYGLFLAKQAIKDVGHTVVVEGNLDVVACHQAGIANTVAVSGTALTEEQLTILKRYGKEIRFFFDMDAAGQKAARRSVELALAQDLSALIITIPEGKDAADLNKEHPDALREAVAKPLPALQYFLDRIIATHGIATPDGKKRILDDYVTLLAAVKHPLEREHYGKAVARALDVEEKMVHGVLHAARVEREKRLAGIAPGPQPGELGVEMGALSKRSERLREELVGILLAFPGTRERWLPQAEPVVREYLEKHVLFFFILQAGGSDPVSLMEDAALKGVASKLLFHVLAEPRIESTLPEEREALALSFADELAKELLRELLGTDRLKAIEQEIKAAQTAGDKERAQGLLEEFVSLSKHHR
jgi:DNA primase